MRPSHTKFLPRRKGKRFADFERLTIRCQRERRAVKHTGQLAVGAERRTRKSDFQSRGVHRIAHQSIADGQRPPIRGPADRYAQTTRARPANIHE